VGSVVGWLLRRLECCLECCLAMRVGCLFGDEIRFRELGFGVAGCSTAVVRGGVWGGGGQGHHRALTRILAVNLRSGRR